MLFIKKVVKKLENIKTFYIIQERKMHFAFDTKLKGMSSLDI